MTRIPASPSSSAVTSVSIFTPPFAAQYAAMPLAAWTALRLAVATIDPPPRAAMARPVLVGQEHAGEADIDDPLPVGQLVVKHLGRPSGARVGDADVEAAEAVDGQLDQGRLIGLARHIALGNGDLLARERREAVLVDVAGHHVRALGDEALDDGTSDA